MRVICSLTIQHVFYQASISQGNGKMINSIWTSMRDVEIPHTTYCFWRIVCVNWDCTCYTWIPVWTILFVVVRFLGMKFFLFINKMHFLAYIIFDLTAVWACRFLYFAIKYFVTQNGLICDSCSQGANFNE